jgi:hypothetical protein
MANDSVVGDQARQCHSPARRPCQGKPPRAEGQQEQVITTAGTDSNARSAAVAQLDQHRAGSQLLLLIVVLRSLPSEILMVIVGKEVALLGLISECHGSNPKRQKEH